MGIEDFNGQGAENVADTLKEFYKQYEEEYGPYVGKTLEDLKLMGEIDDDSKVVGYSLSFCIKSILDDKISQDRIDKIITGTAINDENLEEVLDIYKKTYWKENPELAEGIIKEFLEQGKIEQPRLEGNNTPWIGAKDGAYWDVPKE